MKTSILKIPKTTLPALRASVALAMGAVSAGAAALPDLWTGAAGDRLWSSYDNWSEFPPGATESAQFYAAGAASVAGEVSNIVDQDTTIQGLLYMPTNVFHTTLLNDGVTLSVQSSSTASEELMAARLNTVPETTQGHVTIRGAGRLVVGDTNTIAPTTAHGKYLRVHAASATEGPYWQTLDMSGLDYFAASVSEIVVGAWGSTAGTHGTLLLAKTNNLIVSSSTALGAYIGFSIGLTSSTTGDAASAGDVQLGQANELRAYQLTVGAGRATNTSLGGPGGGVGGASKAGAGGTLEFQSGLVNPTLKIRGVDGQRGIQNLFIGDNTSLGAVNSTNTATGVMDLTGGTVDILAANLQVGRNNGNATATRTGSGSGTLTWTAGIIEVTNLVRIGRQVGNNAASAYGVLNVRNSAILKSSGTFDLGGDAGNGTGSGTGVLNLESGGVVTAAGAIAEVNAAGADGSSTIHINGGYLATGGTITVDNVNLVSGVVSNTGLMTVSALTGNGVVGGPVAGGVAPGDSPGSLATLTIHNDLTLLDGKTSVFDVNLDTLASDKVVGLGNLTLGGTLVVNNVGGLAFATNGARVKLFDAASAAGEFAAFELPALPAGLSWDTSALASGELSIGVKLSAQLTSGGTTLLVTWPAEFLGLYAQSNSVSLANPAAWYDIPGSQLGTSLNVGIDPAKPAVFFRLHQ